MKLKKLMRDGRTAAWHGCEILGLASGVSSLGGLLAGGLGKAAEGCRSPRRWCVGRALKSGQAQQPSIPSVYHPFPAFLKPKKIQCRTGNPPSLRPGATEKTVINSD